MHTCVHYIEVFSAEGTKKSVHCSELGGVHYIEAHLQQKSIGGTKTRVQIGGVHFIEVFINRGFTVFEIKQLLCIKMRLLLKQPSSSKLHFSQEKITMILMTPKFK